MRDTQELIGRLVDEGVADPARIGVTGDSYGGGQSTALAALRNRVMLPDGTLVPWRSPAGTPLSIAAAAPVIPWTDLVYAIAPNGRTLTYAIPGAADDVTPVGVFKETFANGIFAAAQFAVGPGQPVGEPFVQGRPMGYLAPPGTDPEADVAGWVARADAGEPYDDASAKAVVDTLERYHSPYWIDSSTAPAAAVRGERLHRRPVPGRRGAPVREPHPPRAPGRARGDDVRRLRPPARVEQGGRARAADRGDPRLDGPLPARHRGPPLRA